MKLSTLSKCLVLDVTSKRISYPANIRETVMCSYAPDSYMLLSRSLPYSRSLCIQVQYAFRGNDGYRVIGRPYDTIAQLLDSFENLGIWYATCKPVFSCCHELLVDGDDTTSRFLVFEIV